MTRESDLEARIKALEAKVDGIKTTAFLQIKQLTEFHTHTLGGKVVWEFPPELNKKLIEAYQVVLKRKQPDKEQANMEERIVMSDELKIIKTPGSVIKDE